ncbi:metal ABC transporter permease, partial [Patescibacteria group bacterium]
MNIIEAFLTFPFLQRALLAGIIVAVLAGLLGVFVVLRRMAFFSDAMAHIALAGIAIGLLVGWLPFWSALVVSIIAAV